MCDNIVDKIIANCRIMIKLRGRLKRDSKKLKVLQRVVFQALVDLKLDLLGCFTWPKFSEFKYNPRYKSMLIVTDLNRTSTSSPS